MVDGFLCEVDVLFSQMRAALQKGDLVEVGRLGHRMKGTVIYLGAEPAMQAALRVEHFERHSGSPAAAEQAVEALARECDVLKSVLGGYRPPPARR
jgi:HPt (histidine-containing phosphotransfer) domain-containing protein